MAIQAKRRGRPSAMQIPKTASCVDMPRLASTGTVARSWYASRACGAGASRSRRSTKRSTSAILRRVERARRGARSSPSARPVGLRHRARRVAALRAVEPLDVEVDVQDGRQRERSPTSASTGRPGVPAEPGEERRVDDEVQLRVEVAPEHGHAAGEPRELAVGVVEDRLQLDSSAASDEAGRAPARPRPRRRPRPTRRRPPAAARAAAAARARRRARAGGRRARRGARLPARALRERARLDKGRLLVHRAARPGSARARRRPCPSVPEQEAARPPAPRRRTRRRPCGSAPPSARPSPAASRPRRPPRSRGRTCPSRRTGGGRSGSPRRPCWRRRPAVRVRVILVLDADLRAERRHREARDVAGGEDVVAAADAAVRRRRRCRSRPARPAASASSVFGTIPSPATTTSASSVRPDPSVTEPPPTAVSTVSPASTSTPRSR